MTSSDGQADMSEHYSDPVRRVIADPQRRYAYPPASIDAPPLIHRHFTVANEKVSLQAGAWTDYVSRILDTPMSRSQLREGFYGEIDTYVMPDLIYLDSRTDPLRQARTDARISRDSVRDFVFHVVIDGIIDTTTGPASRKSLQFTPGILALDMGQPMRMLRPTAARVLAFFVPRAAVEAAITDAAAIHGQVVAYTTPLARLVRDHVTALCRDLPQLPPAPAANAIRTCAQLIVAAFSKQQRQRGSARGIVHAAVRAQVERHVQLNLYHRELTPEAIVATFADRYDISRPTLYRLFESEGGLAAYIRHCRLREAADELASNARIAVIDVAYGLGFGSASDFTRAFRRSYGMAPMEFRQLGLDMRDAPGKR